MGTQILQQAGHRRGIAETTKQGADASLNTARLMDGNPVLLRLKELEALEKVTEKVDKLTVFSGLDGVLKEMVRINV